LAFRDSGQNIEVERVEETMMTARERISKAIIQMMDVAPFYAELVMRSAIKELPSEVKGERRTMAIDVEGSIYYGEEFVQSLSDEGLMFVLLHEATHKANLHVVRGGMRNHERWNVAIDIVTDHQLKYEDIPALDIRAVPPDDRLIMSRDGSFSLPFIRLPPGKRSAEEVYALLPGMRPQSQGGGGKGQGEGGGCEEQDEEQAVGGGQSPLGKGIDQHRYEMGDGRDFRDIDEVEQEGIVERQRDEIVDAAVKCQKRGKLPANIQRMLDDLLKGKIDWRRYLWKHIVQEMPFDVALRRPSRRFIGQGIILPGIIKENLDVVVMVDLSGSIDNEQKNKFVAECIGIAEKLPSVNMTVVCHDSVVTSVTDIAMADASKIAGAEYRGGGGTSHVPVFDWVREHKPNARLVVAFTDGETEWPERPSGLQVIWVLTEHSVDESKVPFGCVVKMEA
jgi:predicted metal-dependent peptidase